MEQSILTSTKKILGVAADDPSFDLDIMTHINTAFSTLHDLGVGPVHGFAIEDATPVWTDFLKGTVFEQSISQLNKIKTCVYLHTRLLFDPPTTAHLLGAVEKQLQETQWRLSQARENVLWVDPDPPILPDGTSDKEVIILDGGDVY